MTGILARAAAVAVMACALLAAPARASTWRLVLNQDGSQVATWTRTLDGASCTTPGTVRRLGHSAALHVNGSPGQCAEVTYGHRYAYGMFEAEVYLPGAAGGIADWPAFWMIGHGPWPAAGENDIAEGLGGRVCPGFHWDDAGTVGTTGDHCQPWVRPGWHRFTAVWEPGYLAWSYDGRAVLTVRAAWVTSAPEALRFDITTGPYGLLPGVPATMLIRWVKAWQRE